MITSGIARWLGANVPGLSYSETEGGNVFVEWAPSDPTQAVSVYSIVAPESDSKLAYDNVGWQVVARSGNGDAWSDEILAEIYSRMHGLRHVTLPDGTELVYSLATQSVPFRLGDDDNGRPRFSLDFRGEVRNVTQERP